MLINNNRPDEKFMMDQMVQKLKIRWPRHFL